MPCGNNVIRPGSSGLGSRDIDAWYNKNRYDPVEYGERPQSGQNAADFLKTETCVSRPPTRLQEFVKKAVTHARWGNEEAVKDVTILGAYINEWGNGEVWFFYPSGRSVWHYRYHISNNDLSTVKQMHLNHFSTEALTLMQMAITGR